MGDPKQLSLQQRSVHHGSGEEAEQAGSIRDQYRYGEGIQGI